MPEQPLISIPLDVPNVRILQTDVTKSGEFIVTVESTLSSTICRRCGRTLTEQHGVERARLLRHLPILGRPLYLRIRPKRFRCPHCDGHPTTTQALDFYDPDALHTKAFEQHLIVQLVNSTISDVGAKEDVSYAALLGILDRWIAKSLDWEQLKPFTTLGIDESALKKGQRDYVAVITAQTASGSGATACRAPRPAQGDRRRVAATHSPVPSRAHRDGVYGYVGRLCQCSTGGAAECTGGDRPLPRRLPLP